MKVLMKRRVRDMFKKSMTVTVDNVGKTDHGPDPALGPDPGPGPDPISAPDPIPAPEK